MQHRGSEDRLFIGLKKVVLVGYTVVVAGRFVINLGKATDCSSISIKKMKM